MNEYLVQHNAVVVAESPEAAAAELLLQLRNPTLRSAEFEVYESEDDEGVTVTVNVRRAEALEPRHVH